MTTPDSERREMQAEMLDGSRLPLDSARVEALGTLDELSAHLGVVRAYSDDPQWSEQVLALQSDLCLVMSEVADPSGKVMVHRLGEDRVAALFAQANALTPAAATPAEAPADPLTRSVYLARDVALRALRAVEALADQPQPPGEHILAYLSALHKYLDRWSGRPPT